MCIELGLIRRVYQTDKQTNILILLIYIDNNNNNNKGEVSKPATFVTSNRRHVT